MSAIAKVEANDFTPEQIDLIKRVIAPGASNDELSLFLAQCRRTGLDPFAKQIYLIKRQGKMTVTVGIDGYRLIADRSGLYAGNDDPVFDNEEKPTRATVTVYKLVGGQRCPFTATARWTQYFPGEQQGFMWKKMPHLMLGKVAEALALRKAFPAELSGMYTQEEMEQSGEPDPIPQQQPKPVEVKQLPANPGGQHAPPTVADNPQRRAEFALALAQCDSREKYVQICDQIVTEARAGNLSEQDRKILRPVAEETAGRFPPAKA